MSEQEDTLYERIGGEEGIASMVDSFYDQVVEDPVLESYFKNVPIDRLRRMQRELFGAATGGPIIYSGRPLRDVHQGLNISRTELQRFIDILIATLESRNISENDVRDIIARVNLYADDITNDLPEFG